MLSPRKSAITVAQTTITKRVEDIKKVDIDIFKSGEVEATTREYNFTELTPGTPLKLMYMDKTTGYLRFSISANGVERIVTDVLVDAKTKLRPQFVAAANTTTPKNEETDQESQNEESEDSNILVSLPGADLEELSKKILMSKAIAEGDIDPVTLSAGHYEVGASLEEPKGTHFITFKIANCKKNPDGTIAYVGGKKDNGPIVESYESYNYRFFILSKLKEQQIIVSVPIDSYRDALLNVTKLWLLSSRYDRVRRPDWAGFFDKRLRQYTMDDDGAKKVQQDLQAAISAKIPEVLITDCIAKPILKDRSWEVSVTSTDTTTQISTMNMSEKEKSVTISIDSENVSNITTEQIG